VNQGYYRYWGKEKKGRDGFHLLPYHLLDVAGVAWVGFDLFPQWADFFCENLGIQKEGCRRLICWLFALHDIGKFSTSFQKKSDIYHSLNLNDPENKVSNLNHVDLGWLAWDKIIAKNSDAGKSILGQLELSESEVETFERVVMAAIGHHGKPARKISNSVLNNFSKLNIQDLTEYSKEVTAFFEIQKSPMVQPEFDWKFMGGPIRSLSYWLAGYAVLCDWVGSNTHWFKYRDTIISIEEYWAQYAIPQAKEALRQVGLKTKAPSRPLEFSDLFESIVKKSGPTPLQEKIFDLKSVGEPELVIIEDVMGAGKTEAALSLAHRWIAQGKAIGVYFGLPTMATADAMFSRVEKFYPLLFDHAELPTLVLTHSARDLNPTFLDVLGRSSERTFSKGGLEETPASSESNLWVADHRKKALLADVGVGTIDQALMAILATKHQSLRLLGLYRKVLILDEVHASDSYMHGLTRRLLEFHSASGGSAILLSATLPNIMKGELIGSFQKGCLAEPPVVEGDGFSNEYPLITRVYSEQCDEIPVNHARSSLRDVSIQLMSDQRAVESYILEKSKVGSVVWIRNTVNDAIQSYQDLLALNPEIEIEIFHARFMLGDRLDIQNRLISQFGPNGAPEQRKGKIIIATQVVEQSLDVDFDFMVTDLAPIDLVIQRIGRLRRHSRNHLGEIVETDTRGVAELIVYTPQPLENAPSNWIKSCMPGTAAVYENHGHLWLTADWFHQNSTLRIPQDLRWAIKYVFDPNSYDLIPPDLQRSYNETIGKGNCAESQGSAAALDLSNGYISQNTFWDDDVIATTRLGEPVIKIRLARSDGEKLHPLYPHQDEKMAWRLSEVQVRKAKIASEPEYPHNLMAQVVVLKNSWPKLGKYETVIAMNPQSDSESFSGSGMNQNNKRLDFEYSNRFGIRFL